MENSENRENPNKEAMTDYNVMLPLLKIRHLPVSLRSLVNYLVGKVAPAQLLKDLAVADLMPNLAGSIIEIGATKVGNHMRFSNPSNEYVLSNISKKDGYLYLDVMDMSLSDDSVDNFVFIATLEHIPDPWEAINEIHRTLKPGGKLLLTVPFMFPFHAAPSDFFRFTDKALEVLLKDFRVIHFEALGNIFSTIALFLQKPAGWSKYPYRHNSKLTKKIKRVIAIIVKVLCRFIGLMFYFLSVTIRHPDDYAFLYCVLVEKQE
jgi:SAM-dependent methyltransferase